MYDEKKMYEDEYLTTHIDFRDGLVFFHVDVKKQVDKSCVKNARKVFKEIKKSVYEMGYERLYAYTPSGHFARLFGKGYTNIPVDAEEGMQLIVWELEEAI